MLFRSSTQTGFVYDRGNFVQELTGSTVKANLITGGIDEVFQRKEASATRYPITDALGSVVALSDGSGVLQTEYSFEPYGKATATGSTDNNAQTFTGREDDGTGLFYYRARYYMPGCGRFISEDPIGIASGQANWYEYVGGNPVSFLDPYGLKSCSGTARVLKGNANHIGQNGGFGTPIEGDNFAIEDRKSTRLNSSHIQKSRMPSSA